MGLVLQLVETGADSRTRSVDVMEIARPSDLRDIANLGLTLPEAKQLVARVQQESGLHAGQSSPNSGRLRLWIKPTIKSPSPVSR